MLGTKIGKIRHLFYVEHAVTSETIKFTDKNKVGMYPCPISITIDEQCFSYFCRLIPKLLKVNLTKRSCIIWLKKVDAIKKDLTARKVFYSNIVF